MINKSTWNKKENSYNTYISSTKYWNWKRTVNIYEKKKIYSFEEFRNQKMYVENRNVL